MRRDSLWAGLRAKPAWALRQACQEGWTAQRVRTDLLAGVVVGIVALPLSMALGIATGVGPQAGLYASIIAGFVSALTGGSRVQVSGPTAAFLGILVPVVAQHGVVGLVVATFMAGFLLVGLGAVGLGRAISLVPFPVTAGLTAGVGATIALLQLQDFFGLHIEQLPIETLPRMLVVVQHLHTWSWLDAALGCLALAILLGLPKLVRSIPPALVAVSAASLAGVWATRVWPTARLDTIASACGTPAAPHGIAARLPSFHVPWAELERGLDFATLQALFPSAVAIALLGAMISLLSAVVSDGLSGRRHDPDAELMGQGLGNIAASLFGGFASTGAVARTTANVRAGAATPLAAAAHAVFLALLVVTMAPLLGLLPLSALAAVLMVVAWHMINVSHLVRIVRTAPRADAAVLLACIVLTVAFNMITAVLVGIALAGILFIRRMSDLTDIAVHDTHPDQALHLPAGTVVYRVSGPLFFGAAQRAMQEFERVNTTTRHVIVDLQAVPAIDATGLVNLAGAVTALEGRGMRVSLAGLQAKPRADIERALLTWSVRPQLYASVQAALDTSATPSGHTREDEARRQT